MIFVPCEYGNYHHDGSTCEGHGSSIIIMCPGGGTTGGGGEPGEPGEPGGDGPTTPTGPGGFGTYEGGGNGGNSNSTTNTPCSKIKAKFQDTKFKTKYDNISKPEIFNLDHEKGTFERNPPKNSGLQPSFVDIENKIGTTDMSLPVDKSGISGLMHSHQNEDANGLIKMKMLMEIIR